jgi:hypothetical protein
VLWVDGDYCGATGTQDDPYCDPMAALAAVGDDEAAVIKLVAASSPYETPLSVVEGTGKRVAILGIGGPAVRGGQAGLEVGAHHVFVDDIRLSDASVGVQCHAGGHLWIDDSVIIDNQVGVAAQGCELVIRRSRVLASESDAVRLTADSRLELRASVLAGNGADGSPSAALRVDASAFDIVGSTVVDNRGEVANARGGLHCNDGTGRVRNSVIVGPQGDSIDCVGSTVDHSVIDTELQGSEVEVVAAQDPAWFVDMTGLDVHVVSGAGPLLDAAMWWPGDPLTDIDGAAVVATPGRRMYAGADQP